MLTLRMKGESDDRIHIEQLKILARVGVSTRERERSQRLALSVTIWPRFHADDRDDDVTKTVDYSKLCGEAKKFAQGRADKLIETLADAMAEHLLRKFAIRRITVELRKFVLKDAEYVSVTVTRGASVT
jgi:dihydroneopterin aldolase